MSYKIICTDIDGTLLDKNRELSEQTIKEINRIKNRVPIVLVSSRMPKAMRHIQKTLGIEHFPIISYNGGLILTYDDNQVSPKTLLTIPISFDIPKSIYQRTQNTNIHVSLYLDDNWYVENIDYWASREINNTKVNPTVINFNKILSLWKRNKQGPHKIMCMGPETEVDELEQSVQKDFHEHLNIYRSKSTYLELSSKLISKATAMEKLLNVHMGYKLNEAIAFGDNYNDIEMLKAVGLGIAVSNGNDYLKSIADEITLSNIEDGVAVSIKKYFI